MITLYEFLVLVFILVSISLLFFFIQLDRIRANHYLYVYSILALGIVISLIELFVSFGWTKIAVLIFPLLPSLFFLVYPLFYLYARKLVYTEKELSGKRMYVHFSLFTLMLVCTFVFYLSLPAEQKILSLEWRFNEFSFTSIWESFLSFLTLSYYLQFVIYVFLLIKLLAAARGNMSDRIIDKNIVVQWLRYFIVSIVIYELLVFVLAEFLLYELYITIVQAMSLIYLLFLGILRISQSTIEIQTRLRKARLNLEDVHEPQRSYIIDEEEKNELMSLIKNSLLEKKLYRDPNLTLDQFAKKLHSSVKKLSVVINEIAGMSFPNLLNEYRIEEAKKLLHSTKDDMSIENIYLKTGFNSRSTFNRVFKTITGSTPKEFRNSI